jgi:hypothetical protein
MIEAGQAAGDLFACQHEDVVDLIDAAVPDEAPSELQNWQAQRDIADLVDVKVVVLIEQDLISRLLIERREASSLFGVTQARLRLRHQALAALNDSPQPCIRVFRVIPADEPLYGIQGDG